ncbi:MAG TPA: hypothetical protein VFC02_26395, partial [Anaerolineales bacterium]|nr:hypothetical protein [Anaerolineales bacterium]
VPICRIGFQDDAVRTFVREGEAVHQFVRARAPRASALENSPTLLPPAELAVELAIGDMHDDKPGHGPAVRFWKHEADRVWTDSSTLLNVP